MKKLKLSGFGLILLSPIFFGCSTLVSVPPPGQDSPPVVTIAGTVSGGQGSVDPPFSNGFTGQNVIPDPFINSQKALCDNNTKLVITGAAKNAGGVRDFSMKIVQLNGIVLYQTSVSATLNASGKAPNLLSILTGDPGGAGKNPMIITVTSGIQAIYIEVIAHNFNNQETHFCGEYI